MHFLALIPVQEYLSRATARADWWTPPNSHVLGGYDLEREEQGTWLGITKQGRVAVLTNFKEDGNPPKASKSRGGIIKEYLTTPPDSLETAAESAQRLVEGYREQDVGGFSLALGQINPANENDNAGLAIISNRTPDVAGAKWIATGPGMTHGLSNSHYGDRSWPKITQGENLLNQIIQTHANENASEAQLIEKLFEILSVDTLPKRNASETWEAYLFQLRKSIFIPASGPSTKSRKRADEIAAAKDDEKVSASNSSAYGTQRQTVILVDSHSRVVFVERSLFDEGSCVQEKIADRRFEFQLEVPV